MGIIKNIFFNFLVLLVCSLSAQTAEDTISFDGETYVKHIVKAGESLKSISLLHNVTVADIIDNNDIQNNLYYNQQLYIPIYLNEQKNERKESHIIVPKKVILSSEVKDTSVVNIALLMPYFIIKNDTMFKDLEDTNMYSSESALALSFHIGVELALDSLRKKGKNICLHTFDTNKDSLKVLQLVNSNILDNMDIIIGPLFANNFNILCKRYGNDNTRILISPLSKYTENLSRNYTAVYQLRPSFRIEANIIKEYILRHHKNERVVVMNEPGNESNLAYIERLFRKDDKLVDTFTVHSTIVDDIRNYFNEKQVVVIPSENHAFVSKLIGSIGGIDSTFLVFGLYDWKKYDNLDTDNLMFLDVKFPDADSFSESRSHDVSFLRLFEEKYNTNHSRYTYIAYNIIMHFCSDISFFRFQNIKNGGKINISAPLHHYVDYQLVPLE